MLRRLGAIGVMVLGIAACGGSSSNSATQTISLTRAADVSAGAHGYKSVMSMQESVPSLGQLTIAGNGSFSSSTHAGSMTMQMNIPSAAAQQAGLSNARFQVVLVPGTVYMKLPPQLAEKLPGAKPWWEINLAQAGKLAGIPGLSSLINGTSSESDPGQYLYFLRATSSGSVKDLGQETINGIQTTHYRAEIDLQKLPDAVPARDRAGVEQLTAALQKRAGLPSGLPMNVWIDSHQLIRQIETNFSESVNGQAITVAMKENFLDYGPQPAPQIPPPDQTVNLVKLLQQHGVG
ncbi:MAG TPA: hypothetical protein VMD09_07890 [Solirubrobacteraceae bacterium]|nr:hypothetical protein [Solirubrobacteraceae bacterium]